MGDVEKGDDLLCLLCPPFLDLDIYISLLAGASTGGAGALGTTDWRKEGKRRKRLEKAMGCGLLDMDVMHWVRDGAGE